MVLPRFLAELKHRNVYRAALVYAAVGWALLEAADVVLPRLGLPDWTVNLVLALVLLGFPLAIVFAWIFDVSAQGIVRTEPISPHVRHRFSFVSIAEFVLICVLVVTVGYLYVDRLSLQKRLEEPEIAVQVAPAIPNPEQYRAIAVLPFVDMSEAGDQAWFGQGISEELLIALSQVDGLNVVARTSSFAFRETDKTIAEIAEILGVQAVLEGSVRRSGDFVRISAQLVDAASGYRLWSDSYERKIANIFELQDELAKSVVNALGIELGFAPTDRLIINHTENIEAYNLFIRGRTLFDWANAKTHLQSIHYFEQAVEADPNYALAWGYLAFALSNSVIWRPLDDIYPAAFAAYERALGLNPEQSEALAAKAAMAILKQWNWKAAGELYQRSMASKENFLAVTGYGVFFAPAIDGLAEAVRLYQEAEKLDPLQVGIKANLAIIILVSGDLTGSIQKAQEALELEPGHLFAFMALIDAYTQNGQYSEAKAVLEKIPRELHQNPSIKAREGLYYASSGDYEKAEEIYRGIVNSSHPVPVAISGALGLALGDTEGAIDLMESVADNHAFSLPWLRALYRQNEILKEHPRYLALLQRIGLDDKSVAMLQVELSL